MGFNISGLVINKNYKDKLSALEEQFGWNLEFEKEIDFETASENWKEEGICDIYFTAEGTLIFLGMEALANAFFLKTDNCLKFVLSETSMTFVFDYYEKESQVRNIIETEGDRVEDAGEQLTVEAKSEDTSEVIWNQMGEMLGERFWDIDLEEKAYRYRLVNNKDLKKHLSKEESNPEPVKEKKALTEEEKLEGAKRVRKINNLVKLYKISIVFMVIGVILTFTGLAMGFPSIIGTSIAIVSIFFSIVVQNMRAKELEKVKKYGLISAGKKS